MNSLFIMYPSSWSEYPFFPSLHPRGSALYVLGPTIVMILRISLLLVTFTVPLSICDMYHKIVVVPNAILTISRSEQHLTSLPHTFQKKRTSTPHTFQKKRTSIRPNEDTTSLTMDWPELQRSSRTQLPVQHVYNWESVDDQSIKINQNLFHINYNQVQHIHNNVERGK